MLLGECEDLLPLLEARVGTTGNSEFEVTAADFVAPHLETLNGLPLGGDDALDELDNI